MEPTPQAIATTSFRIVKKGYDPDEVRAYLTEVARTVEASHAHAQSMETRARQAIAKANEAAASAGAQSGSVDMSSDANTISRTLLLAQRTADETVAAARAEAAGLEAAAREESNRLLSEASAQAAKTVNDAKGEARRVGEAEKLTVNEEVQQLLARLEFLKDDVSQMEAHVLANRERVAEVAGELEALASRSVGGLGPIRRPTLSASADELRGRHAVVAAATPVATEVPVALPAPTVEAAKNAGDAAIDAAAVEARAQEPTTAIPTIRRVSESIEAAPDAPRAFTDDFFDDVSESADLQLALDDTGDHDVTAEVPTVSPAPGAPRLSMKFIDDDSL